MKDEMKDELMDRDDFMERDVELGRLLAGVSGEAPVDRVDWAKLREETVARVAWQARTQRSARRRRRVWVATAMAASVALLFVISRPAGDGGGTPMAAGAPNIEEILTGDASDEEVRALLSGAGDPELLLLAASDSE